MSMPKTNSERLNYLFAIMGRTLALCCHREVGNFPTLPRSGEASNSQRPELA